MKEAGKILTYALLVLVLGALLAPVLWWLGQWGIEQDIVPALSRFRFDKYFNRAVLIVALAGLWPLMRWLGVRDWKGLGIDKNPRRWADLGLGAVLGVGGLGLVGALTVLAGSASLRSRVDLAEVGLAVITALTVAIVEEIFFRGALLGVVRRNLSWLGALAFVSILFASVHFIKPHGSVAKGLEVTWWSGFYLIPHVFWRFRDPGALLAGWLTLFVVGWTLGYVTIKTRSLYFAIGLHAGWVFALKTFTAVTQRGARGSIWIGRDPIVGLVPLLLLLTTLLLAWRFLRSRDG